MNAAQKVRVSPAQLLTGHKLWATLDYVERPDVRGNLEWKVERAGTEHGIVVWFDADLAEGVRFSNAPGAPETVYGSFFFPWTQPGRLAQQQSVGVNLAAKLVENDYLWRWTTHIELLSGSGASPIHFDQSRFAGAILSGGQLRKIAADYIPQVSDEGLLRRRTLELMDGRAPLEEIAHTLVAEFPSASHTGRKHCRTPV